MNCGSRLGNVASAGERLHARVVFHGFVTMSSPANHGDVEGSPLQAYSRISRF